MGAISAGHLEVADMIVLGSCSAIKKEMVSLHRITMLSSYCYLKVSVRCYVLVSVSDPKSSTAAIKRTVMLTELASSLSSAVYY